MRRALLVGVAAVCLVLTSCQQTWLQFGSDPAHTGTNASESAIGLSNAGQLAADWSTSVSSADGGTPDIAVTASTVIVNGDDRLVAYPRDGATGCGGAPKSCAPLWTSRVPAQLDLTGAPAVVGSTVFVASSSGPVDAYDTDGVTGCSGTPTVCSPLWTDDVAGSAGSVAVSGNEVFTFDAGHHRLAVFDATGAQGCAGTPKVCEPLWTSTSLGNPSRWSTPAIDDSRVYVTMAQGLVVFDATGTDGCSGVPTVCSPLWTAPTTGQPTGGPTVAGGRVLLGAYTNAGPQTAGPAELLAFDAAGTDGCVGVPITCSPLWSAPFTAAFLSVTPTVASGTVYINGAHQVAGFDLAGLAGCGGSPVSCAPIWSTTTVGRAGRPTVADGVLWVGIDSGLAAYDPTGSSGCSGSPAVCAPVASWPWTTSLVGEPVVVDDQVYLADESEVSGSTGVAVSAYRLPAS
jgi:hypothetical protein